MIDESEAALQEEGMNAKDVALDLDLASGLGRRVEIVLAYQAVVRREALAPVRLLCAEFIAGAPNPMDNAFDAGAVWMARQVLDLLDLLGKEEE